MNKLFDSLSTLLLPSAQSAKLMKSPEGELSPSTFVLFYRWVSYLEHHQPKDKEPQISAAFGKPTAPIDPDLLEAMRHYWNYFPDKGAIPYCDSAGLWNCRTLMAEALFKQYKGAVNFNPEHIIFTVGGCSALQAAFSAIHHKKPKGKLITIVPFYPQYEVLNGGSAKNILHPIDVTKTGFQLTAEALETSLSEIAPQEISAFVICDPNNPCGTTPGLDEWLKIAAILKKYADIPIVLDEAYAEMCFHGSHVSLLEAAPELAPRTILMRSATKGLSAAGERMALAVVPDNTLRDSMMDFVTNTSLHAPISHQYAYTHAMQKLTEEKKRRLGQFYHEKVIFTQEELKRIGIEMKNPSYKPNSTFYLLTDLKKLKGKPLDIEAAKILGKEEDAPLIETDIDIAYHLLFAKNLALAPLSFFGMDPQNCLFRITCSDNHEILQEIIKRLEETLTE